MKVRFSGGPRDDAEQDLPLRLLLEVVPGYRLQYFNQGPQSPDEWYQLTDRWTPTPDGPALVAVYVGEVELPPEGSVAPD